MSPCPRCPGNLGATTDEIAWVSTGYILSNVIVLPMTAWLSGRFGRKRYLMASILIFNIARFMCGLSGSLGEIIFWRLVQGAGGAALISTGPVHAGRDFSTQSDRDSPVYLWTSG